MKILFGVSDWGLGHATRDIPLIEGLLAKKARVDIVSTGRAMILLRNYFGKKCNYYDIPTMKVRYSKGRMLIPKFITTLPLMFLEITKSRRTIKRIIRENKYDKVISDCRFDTYDKRSNSILINHQLWIAKPFYTFPISSFLVFNANKNFGRIIVPDFPGSILTDSFSNSMSYFVPVDFIGIISHLKKKKLKQDIDYFISLSGPEPQRTVLEHKIFEQIKHLKGKVVIGLGKPEDKTVTKKNNIEIYGFLDAEKQEEMMNRAKFIISRPGYTTVMDIIELEKRKALFIPTPSQPEQEYFGYLYDKKKLFEKVDQENLELRLALKNSSKYHGFDAPWKTKESVKRFVKIIYS
jgi:uncharacterized protein (TIGR00661 family)